MSLVMVKAVNIRYFPPYRVQITHGQHYSFMFALLSSVALMTGGYLGLGASFLTRLHCEREPTATVVCAWQSVKVGSRQSYRLTAVQRAFPVRVSRLPRLYQLHIQTTTTDVNLPHSTTLQKAKLNEQAQQINQLLRTTPRSAATHLDLQWDQRWLGYSVGMFLGAIGFLGLLRALLCPLIYECMIDHRRGLITIEYRGLVRHCITHYHLLKNLRSVQVHRSDWDDQVHVRLLLSPGEFIVLRMSGRDRLATAEAIATFVLNP